jgi:hypothetical protein
MSTGSTSAYVGACRKDIPYPSVSHESVPSLIDNLVSALYGPITKTVVNRKIVWNVQCNPSTYAPIFGVTPTAGEGTLCYIMRALSMADTMNGIVYTTAIQTLTNKTLTAPIINNAIVSNLTGTGTLAGNASTATTLQTARTIALSGDVTGTATSFDGSANISIPVTINAGSVTPADLSTGGPSWNTSSELTARRMIAHGNAGITTNSAFGLGTLASVTTGNNNTAVGNNALFSVNTGVSNTAVGYNALIGIDGGIANVAIGAEAMGSGGSSYNTAVGYMAFKSATLGPYNTAVGASALTTATTGTSNTAVGAEALEALTTGSRNTAIGYSALSTLTTGSNNVGIGRNAEPSTTTITNEVNIFNGTVTARFQGAAAAWSFVSDERDKSDVTDLEIGIDFINKLQPRKFKWAIRNCEVDQGKEATGFIAQEVLSAVNESQANYLGLVDTNNPEQFTFASTNLIPILVNAIKELKAEVEALKAKQ